MAAIAPEGSETETRGWWGVCREECLSQEERRLQITRTGNASFRPGYGMVCGISISISISTGIGISISNLV